MLVKWPVALIFYFFLVPFQPASAFDAIPVNQTFRFGDRMVSSNGQFELGFFNFSSRGYLGIWYKSMANGTIIWVANRDTPLYNSLGTLQLTSQGNLLLLNSTIVVWESNAPTKTAINPVAQLLDTGNLVISEANDENPDNYLWQSFDHPGNTFMPTMRYGVNLETGLNRYLTSWKSNDDPSDGAYVNKLDPSGFPQFFLLKNNQIIHRSGPWIGERFSGMINLNPNPIYDYEFVNNGREIYYHYTLKNSSVLSRMVLTPNGALERQIWTGAEGPGGWAFYLNGKMDDCDDFNRCGPFGSCNISSSQACSCLDGFQPKDELAWKHFNWSGGCLRKHKLDCRSDGLKRVSRLKLPDTRKAWYDGGLSLKECKNKCLKNCSCVACANSDVRNGGSGCLMWFDDLIDMREYAVAGQDLYLRVSIFDFEKEEDRRWLIKILVPVLTVGVVVLVLSVTLHMQFRNKPKVKGIMPQLREEEPTKETDENDLELPLFNFEVIVCATNNFALENRLGRGGFGLVYKGTLRNGEVVAVKRLSKNSKQGVDEFKNEVSCIAKLQHRNLVKLLGCCVKDEERMLVYEFMPNKSLDLVLFDDMRKGELDWRKRFNIICGIARGLVYLHHDSRLRIIHRDLKAANVLLDQDLNPKISDFGMAKIFGGEDTQVNTTRVVGTYGYMAPEYAVDGLFSPKTDVFSFGVLVLEIVSGTKNRGFNHPDHDHNLLGHAWRLYKEGRLLELLDPLVKESCVLPELIRSIHIGLLCVQQSPEDRPSMSMVALMLGSNIELAEPKQPGFFTPRKFWAGDALRGMVDESANQITITFLDAR